MRQRLRELAATLDSGGNLDDFRLRAGWTDSDDKRFCGISGFAPDSLAGALAAFLFAGPDGPAVIDTTACPGTVKLVKLPSVLAEAWPPETLRRIFTPDAYIVHPKIPEAVVKWLQNKGQLTQPANDELLRALTKPEIPKPERKEQFFTLWTPLSPWGFEHQF